MTKSLSNCFVYLISAEDVFFKIGISVEVENRIRQLKTGCPFKITKKREIEYDLRGAKIVEKYLHKRYHTSSKNGEWFVMDSSDIQFIMTIDKNELWQLAIADLPDKKAKVEKAKKIINSHNGIISHVKNHFEKRSFTAADFARWCARREIDLSYYTARRVVSGETDITLSTAGTVAEFLGVPLNELFTVQPTPAPEA